MSDKFKTEENFSQNTINNPLANLPNVAENFILDEAKYLFEIITLGLKDKLAVLEVYFMISSENENILLSKGFNIEYYINTSIGKLNGKMCTKIFFPKKSVNNPNNQPEEQKSSEKNE